MAVRQFTLPVEPENDKKGLIAIIVDPATGYSPTVNSAGALKVQTDATIELGDVQIKNKAGTAVIEPATEDTLALILAKIIAAPATQATLAAVLAKLSADPATQTTLAALNGKVAACNTGAVTVSAALPAGTNLLGKIGIDQTTPGTTNAVVEASAAAILAATQTDILALSDPIAVTASVTLATMLGVALNASLKKLTLISSDPTKIVYWAKGGAASAATAVLLPVGALSAELLCSKTAADTLQLFAPASVGITILQEG